MTRQQRRYRERELHKIAKGMAAIVGKKNKTVVVDNQFNFLKEKADRFRRWDSENIN